MDGIKLQIKLIRSDFEAYYNMDQGRLIYLGFSSSHHLCSNTVTEELGKHVPNLKRNLSGTLETCVMLSLYLVTLNVQVLHVFID